MVNASGVRIGWHDLPDEVRAAVETIIGAPVIEAVSQVGGFSPGTADRVRTADGRRAFVKAVSPAQNEFSPGALRRESTITAALPRSVPAPRVLGSYDDGTWVALVLQDIDGRHPRTPWQLDELTQVLNALRQLADAPIPACLSGLETATDKLAEDFAGWHRIAADPPAHLHPWAERHLDDLCDLADQGLAALTGDTLTHVDIRADNLLVGQDGTITVVDWPWACRGPAWLDTLLLLANVRLYGGHDTNVLLRRHTADLGADEADLFAVLAGFAGFFADAAREPAPAGLPTLRAFQQAQADALLSWLADVGVGR